MRAAGLAATTASKDKKSGVKCMVKFEQRMTTDRVLALDAGALMLWKRRPIKSATIYIFLYHDGLHVLQSFATASVS
jgi:hypothetical protein